MTNDITILLVYNIFGYLKSEVLIKVCEYRNTSTLGGDKCPQEYFVKQDSK